MKNTIELLKDNQFFADLLNGPCKPISKPVGEPMGEPPQEAKERTETVTKTVTETPFKPINPGWIDDELSEHITKVYHSLLPGSMPYDTIVRVVRNPDVLMNGVAVDDESKRTRYIVVTVLRDYDFPYSENFPLIQVMGIVCLNAWELSRSAIAASEKFAEVLRTKHPVPPFLNNAYSEWVCLYVGTEGFKGRKNLRSMIFVDEDTSDDLEFETHLYDMRRIDDPLAQKLVEAADTDSAQGTTVSN